MEADTLIGIAVVAIAFCLVILGPFGLFVAAAKRRSKLEGFLLGLLFGPFGILIEALLPNGERPAPAGRPRPDPMLDVIDRDPPPRATVQPDFDDDWDRPPTSTPPRKTKGKAHDGWS
ncbi:MAG: hypothetical protein AB7G11_02760 [Phycisphaerales bacterium]